MKRFLISALILHSILLYADNQVSYGVSGKITNILGLQQYIGFFGSYNVEDLSIQVAAEAALSEEMIQAGEFQITAITALLNRFLVTGDLNDEIMFATGRLNTIQNSSYFSSILGLPQEQRIIDMFGVFLNDISLSLVIGSASFLQGEQAVLSGNANEDFFIEQNDMPLDVSAEAVLSSETESFGLESIHSLAAFYRFNQEPLLDPPSPLYRAQYAELILSNELYDLEGFAIYAKNNLQLGFHKSLGNDFLSFGTMHQLRIGYNFGSILNPAVIALDLAIRSGYGSRGWFGQDPESLSDPKEILPKYFASSAYPVNTLNFVPGYDDYSRFALIGNLSRGGLSMGFSAFLFSNTIDVQLQEIQAKGHFGFTLGNVNTSITGGIRYLPNLLPDFTLSLDQAITF
jgi:hypothetical protein